MVEEVNKLWGEIIEESSYSSDMRKFYDLGYAFGAANYIEMFGKYHKEEKEAIINKLKEFDDESSKLIMRLLNSEK